MSVVQIFAGLVLGWAMIACGAALFLSGWSDRVSRFDGAAHDERPLRRARR